MIITNYKILTKELVLDRIDDLKSICRDVPHENWDNEKYLVDLPGKWEVSIASFNGNILMGYIIASEKVTGTVHIHKFIVNPSFRRQGIGRDMLKKLISHAGKNISKITLKVYEDNPEAIDFYRAAGFTDGGKSNGLLNLEMKINR
jgi:ribosomal protein S18 acetylase RimI-like enzyme